MGWFEVLSSSVDYRYWHLFLFLLLRIIPPAPMRKWHKHIFCITSPCFGSVAIGVSAIHQKLPRLSEYYTNIITTIIMAIILTVASISSKGRSTLSKSCFVPTTTWEFKNQSTTNNQRVWDQLTKMPSEMEVATRYALFTLFILFTLFTLFTLITLLTLFTLLNVIEHFGTLMNTIEHYWTILVLGV